MNIQEQLENIEGEINEKFCRKGQGGQYYTSWFLKETVTRQDLLDFLHTSSIKLLKTAYEEVINELESNPNEDGSVSPNIQHWIEQKQRQLRNTKIVEVGSL